MDGIITYDIADTGGKGRIRLRKIADLCSAYGARMQLSVYEFRLSPEKYERFVGELRDILDSSCDSVVIYRFPGELTASRTILGSAIVRDVGDPWIL